MSGGITLSGTPEGGSVPAAINESGRSPPADETTASAAVAASEPTAAADVSETDPAPVSMFRPTMRDGSSTSETGRTVPTRPLESQPDDPADGGIAPCDGPDGAADQALILGPPDQDAAGDGAAGAGMPDGTTAPAVAADLIDGTNLFGDRAAMWSGNPSEVGAGYGVDPQHADLCLCDETSLAAGQDSPDLAS